MKSLNLIASGTTREVFNLTKDSVIKLAFNNKGVLQNQAEVSISQNHPTCQEIAKIIAYDPSFKWVVQQKVNILNAEKFKTLFKIEAKAFLYNLRHRKNLTNIYQSLDKAIINLNLDRYEICNGLSNIGEKDGKLIILDYGIMATSTVKSPVQPPAGTNPIVGDIVVDI